MGDIIAVKLLHIDEQGRSAVAEGGSGGIVGQAPQKSKAAAAARRE